MVAALASRELAGAAVNRKRAQRLMREHRLLQPKCSEGRRRRPGYFQVTRPDEPWHLDMTSVWVAEHGWCYLSAAIDCCTREITCWSLELRCRAQEGTAVIGRAIAERGVGPGELTRPARRAGVPGPARPARGIAFPRREKYTRVRFSKLSAGGPARQMQGAMKGGRHR
jgi:transposase InsO family protein